MPSITDSIGRVVGDRYRLVTAVGEGASAHVYLAEDASLDRRVAIKVLHPALAGDTAFLKRFRAEAQAVAALNHPNILQVYDWGEEDGVPYLVLEFLAGGSLRQVFDTGALLSPEQAVQMGIEASAGLDYAHRRGLVNRDIKPANLLFDADGRLRIADFGLARALAEASWTEPEGAILGTARYSAPEQVEGWVLDGKADVYALALVLYEGVTGEAPFIGDTTLSTLMARVGVLLPEHEALGPLNDILVWAAAPEPSERYDAAQLGLELKDLAASLPRPEPLPRNVSVHNSKYEPDEVNTPQTPKRRSSSIIGIRKSHKTIRVVTNEHLLTVLTGFCRPDAAIDERTKPRFVPDNELTFWVSIEANASAARAGASKHEPTTLDVVLYPRPDGFILSPQGCHGQFLLHDGRTTITRQPRGRDIPYSASCTSTSAKPLSFSIRTPTHQGEAAFRCSIYARGTLLQSILIRARVHPSGPTDSSSDLDYLLHKELSSHLVAKLPSYALSIWTDLNSNGLRSFDFFSPIANATAATLVDSVLVDRIILQVPNGWGLSPSQIKDIVNHKRDLDMRTSRLFQLASRGQSIWNEIIGQLSKHKAAELRYATRHPGHLEILPNSTPKLKLLLAQFYDYPLDPRPADRITLCPAYVQYLQREVPLKNSDCFFGNCPSREFLDVVCPGGFWAKRHEIVDARKLL